MSGIIRYYQREAIEAIGDRFAAGDRATMAVLPTGAGKTVVFAKVAEKVAEASTPERRRRSLVVAHRKELIKQAREKIQAWTSLSVGTEMADERVDKQSIFGLPDVVVSSVQTMSRRLEQWPPDTFDLVIVDEAHRVAGDTYLKILAHFKDAKILGVTATPDGGDVNRVFQSTAYGYDIRQAIEDGFLCNVRRKVVFLESLDFSAVRTTAGDLNEGDMDRLMREESVVASVAKAMIEYAGPRRAMLFGVTVAHAHVLAAAINRYAGRHAAEALDGESPDAVRTDTLARWEGGVFQYLCNCALFTEGFDSPGIECVGIARPTKKRSFYAQMVGRGTRPAPGKVDLLVVDLTGETGKHSLATIFDVIDGSADPDVRARAEAMMAKEPLLNVTQAIDRAAEEIAEETRKKALKEAKYHAIDLDPFTIVKVRARPGRWGGMPVSQKQAELLDKLGWPIKKMELDAGQASAILTALFKRRDNGLCTFKQAKVLARHGYDPDVPFDRARQLIDAIAANGWKRPATDPPAAAQ